MREFRGAWIATVGNIDWPSKPGLSAMEQKAELRALMEGAVKLRLNALLLQVRPGCDAFYKSSIEPWSEFLTGQMGKAPEPAYDPLQFAIEEAHARGLELHAWFNPYRAGFASTKSVSSRHISKTHPKWIRRYGSFLWLDPSEPGVQDYVLRVILDVVRRYDIDGVHMDDYFYPYPETNKAGTPIDFPDDSNWRRYVASHGRLSRGDWRRAQVNSLVERLQKAIHREKSWVSFGISPFGIWRPGFPPQIRGFDAYDKLYADSRHWLIKGWVDYIAPQLYWPIDPPEQSYLALLAWWQKQSVHETPVWPGGAITRVGKRLPAEEIIRQIELTRRSPQPGYIHWSLTSLLKNPENLESKLISGVYAEPAIVPATRPVGSGGSKPSIRFEKKSGATSIQWRLPNGQVPRAWALQTRKGDGWRTEIIGGRVQSRDFTAAAAPEIVAITAVLRNHGTSPTAVLEMAKEGPERAGTSRSKRELQTHR
jgi:uncharacterized lipoprotein YddW (UPF0748 family)